MTLLWSLIGSNPWYERFCGLAEVVPAVLLLYRRTALVGAVVTAFVMCNVVSYNFFCDVPVKIYALHLLLAALFVTLPDLKAMVDFFWRHVPAAATGVWVPPAERRIFRHAAVAVEVVVLLSTMLQNAYSGAHSEYLHYKSRNVESPLRGGWHVVQAIPPAGPKSWLTQEQQPISEIWLDHASSPTRRVYPIVA